MAKTTIVFGVILIGLGLVGYFGWEQLGANRQSWTALIPAFVGVLLAGLGALALATPSLRMHAMHAAAALGLLGFLAGGRGIVLAIQWLGGIAPRRPTAVAMQAIMGVVCLIYVGLTVRSFIEARRRRRLEGTSAP